MNLFQISNQYQEIFNETFNQETGEINENSLAKLDQITTDIKEKSIAVASFIRNLEAEKKAIEEAKEEMNNREKKLNNRVNSLTSYLQSNMERCGINEISCPYFVIKLKKCPASIDIIDDNIIPIDFKKSKEVISFDKIKLKAQILAGIVVPGAILKQNTRLEIR